MAENITAEQEVYEVDKLTLLDCKKIRLAKEESGFLTLDYEGKTYHKVNPTRLIPFYSKTTYISLSYENSEKEFREIGVIKDMAELDGEQYKLLDSYLGDDEDNDQQLHQEQPPPIAQQKKIFQAALDTAHIYLLPEKYAQHK